MSYALVVGDPIAHSLSPVIHLAAYRELGLDWDFDKQRVCAGCLSAFIRNLSPGCRGMAVTMPLKAEALEYADFQDGLAKLTGVANTLVFDPGYTTAFNTDVAGIVGAYKHAGFQRDTAAEGVIFGGGATAASALAALWELGARHLSVVSRNPGGSGLVFAAAARMHLPLYAVSWDDSAALARTIANADLIMNTVPAGAQPKLPLTDVQPPANAYVLDAIYAPWPTPVALWARSATVIPGWEILLYQGISQVKLFTGSEISPDVIRGKIRGALSQD